MNKSKNWSLKSEKGQMSVFLGICLIIILTMMAMVINVGLFVKAKINLQNAVDAAAWSGAATQARQLTNVGYLNWELRNVYKEWMFKYYVIGQKALPRTNLNAANSAFENGSDSELGQPSTGMNFRLPVFFKQGDPSYSSKIYDKFNIPSICIHQSKTSNVCATYSLPGLPRFKTANLPGVGDAHEKFLNSVVATKAKDCSVRSDLNFGVAMIWAFGTKSSPIPVASSIAADRLGAWPKALELALRMRNLELIINRPAVEQPICLGGDACMTVDTLDNQYADVPFNERPIKAFWSAIRNLGGGDRKSSDPLVSDFRLTEISPQSKVVKNNSLSGYLIENKTINGWGKSSLTKTYLDLEIVPLNLVTFYTTFVTNTGSFEGTTKMEGNCPSSKTAIPVPAYIFGFMKNPRMLTYYAVKGQSKYLGLFYPFDESGGIGIRAYAAAKPFGARIGPRLFGTSGESTITPRQDQNNRSAAYLSGIDVKSISAWKAGDPIPHDTSFWVVDDKTPIGGPPGSAANTTFAIPNLLYTFPKGNLSSIGDAAGGAKIIESLADPGGEPASKVAVETLGLYNKDQFISFAANLQKSPGDTQMTAEQINDSIISAKKPTPYEAMNYLIPTVSDPNDNFASQFSINIDSNGGYSLYAPLFSDNLMYTDPTSVENIVNQYINDNKSSIDAFTDALDSVATAIQNSASKGGGSYKAAADTIHNGNLDLDCDNQALAAKFNHFFLGTGEKCDIKPLRLNVREWLDGEIKDSPGFKNYAYFEYEVPPESEITKSDIHTAFMPGLRRGADDAGMIEHPFGLTGPINGKRNFYSTKFIAIEKVLAGGQYNYNERGLYYESPNYGTAPSDLRSLVDGTFDNMLRPSAIGEWRGRTDY
ncbi:MAG: Tad domain-containing protein [Bacteriovoracaceae bacterium]